MWRSCGCTHLISMLEWHQRQLRGRSCVRRCRCVRPAVHQCVSGSIYLCAGMTYVWMCLWGEVNHHTGAGFLNPFLFKKKKKKKGWSVPCHSQFKMFSVSFFFLVSVWMPHPPVGVQITGRGSIYVGQRRGFLYPCGLVKFKVVKMWK